MDQGRRPIPGLLARGIAVALLTAALVVCALAAQTPAFLFETLPAADNAQPVQLNADTIATWKVAGKQIIRLRGNVVVTQGQSSIRTPDCVIWVDLPTNAGDSTLTLTIYGESSITLDRKSTGLAPAQADYGYVRTVTSKVGFAMFKDKLLEQDQSADPVYQRALQKRPAELLQGTTGADTGLVAASALQPALAPPVPVPFSTPLTPGSDPSRAPPPPPMVKQDVYFQPVPEPPPAPAPGAPPQPQIFFNTTPPAEPKPGDPAKPPPHLSVRPRFGSDLQVEYKPVEDGRTAVIVGGGVIVNISTPAESAKDKGQFIDIEADRLVIWTKGNAQQLFGKMKSEGADSGAHELYLSGHVEMRTRSDQDIKTLRAAELYYDVRRNVAVARDVDFEIVVPKALFPLHIKTPELQQLGPKLWSMKKSEVFSSLIPSDPGLILDISNMTIEERQYDKSYLYGLIPAYDKDGKRSVQTDHVFTGNNYFAYLEGVPVFYFPYFRGRVEDPLGPLDGVNAGYDQIFGFQIHTTWDLYDIFDLPHFEGTKWQLYLDYLTSRGPGFGTFFDFAGKDPFGITGKYNGDIKLYGMFDTGTDILGGNRGQQQFWPDATTSTPVNQPEFRGWAYGKVNVQDLPDGFSFQGQFAFLSDRNFQEVYFLDNHMNSPNNDTYFHLKDQQGNWAWTLDAQTNTQDWFTHTDWLPKADGYLMGQTFSFGKLAEDLFVLNTHVSAGYAELHPTVQVPFAYAPTDVRVNTARLDWMSDLSMPLDAGPFKITPYVKFDVAYYSQDVNGDSLGRVYGGGGVRWSMPLSRLYPDIQSELFNINEIYHKIILYGNYFASQSSTNFNNLPQLDRLNDDTTDQTLRDIRPQQSALNPSYAFLLSYSNLFNPQYFALRRLIDNSPDTLDTMNVLQLGIDQRWQTQRGFPGDQHVVDWMSLNLQASIFPHSERDDLGHTLGILEYNWAWNIGDRTALSSKGFYEPFTGGCRAFDFGATLGRPDSTNLYIGYQQIDPLDSKAVIAAVTFPFSAKYALTASTVWDFGTNVSSYSLFVSRMGTDVIVNFGVSFNSTLNTVGVAFEVLPNVARGTGHSAGLFPGLQPTNVDPILNQK